MKFIFLLLTPTLIFSLATADHTYLTPLDFGLSLMDHGMVDYVHTPPNILVANFNHDSYPDIAHFEGNRLEIFIFQGLGYTPEPQSTRTFDKPIKSLRLDDNIWDGIDDLVMTFTDGSEETLHHRGGCLDLTRNLGTYKRAEIPRRVSEADFEIVWESEPRPFGMNRCAVGDLDNDGIIELVTWWKEWHYADTAYVLVYKCIGNDEYELFMEEEFSINWGTNPYITFLLITDIDQNGQNELVYFYDGCYFWEFSEPGVYTAWVSNFTFPRAVKDVEISDVDQDSILEISAVTTTSDLQPPTAYIVREYGYKTTVPDNMITFISITGFYQDWPDMRLAVGDFDNDGAVDIVSGNFGFGSSNPVDIQYLRYDPSCINNFSQNWLYTGIPLTCATPVIADLDSDGENELFAGGHCPGHGSAFVWEATGFQTGYVAWLDTTSAPGGPNYSCFGYIDYNPSVLLLVRASGRPLSSVLSLWMYQNNMYIYAWESAIEESTDYRYPHIMDIDHDGKMNILLVNDDQHIAVDWEQTSAGIQKEPYKQIPQAFILHDNYPNPFNSVTVIPFEIATLSDVQLSVYNLSGQIVYKFEAEDVPPGYYTVDWDATGLPSGIYLIELWAGSEQQIRKGVLLK